MSHRHRKYKDYDWLHEQYIEKQKSPHKIAQEAGVSTRTVVKWIRRFRFSLKPYEDNKKKRAKRAAKKRRRASAYKYLGNECVLCGCKDHCCLEFHHIFPENKRYNIAKGFSKPWKYLVEELDKCCLLCSNCHRRIHSNKKLLKQLQKQTGEKK